MISRKLFADRDTSGKLLIEKKRLNTHEWTSLFVGYFDETGNGEKTYSKSKLTQNSRDITQISIDYYCDFIRVMS